MNKQEAVSQIMEIKAVLSEQLQTKLIEAVKVLASFKMISVDDSMPYDHSKLTMRIDEFLFLPVCICKYENGTYHSDYMYRDSNSGWTWCTNNEELHGKVTHWLATSIVSGPYIKDEFGNELEIE